MEIKKGNKVKIICGKDKNKEGEIIEIDRKNFRAKVKGLNPFPGVWFVHKRARIKIISATVTSSRGNPGEVLDDELTIACKEKSIKISMLQKEGKKKLTSKDFLTGYKIKKGEKLSW